MPSIVNFTPLKLYISYQFLMSKYDECLKYKSSNNTSFIYITCKHRKTAKVRERQEKKFEMRLFLLCTFLAHSLKMLTRLFKSNLPPARAMHHILAQLNVYNHMYKLYVLRLTGSPTIPLASV